MNVDRSRLRLVVVQALVLSLMLTLLGRLAYLQVVDGESYSRQAESNRVREVVTQAARGPIVDDVGRPLVRNRTSMVVSVNRALLPGDDADREAMLDRLSGVLGLSRADLDSKITPCKKNGPRPCYNGSPYQPIPVFEGASQPMTLAIQEHRDQFSGVSVEPQAVREFPQQRLAAQMLGYLSPISPSELNQAKKDGVSLARLENAQVGRTGLESQYDDYLRGTPGVQRLQVDRSSKVEGVLSQTPPLSGNTLVLNLDTQIQKAAEDSLAAAVDQARQGRENSGPLKGQNYAADSGSMVVLNADTGGVVAMASYPTYDPSVWVGGISQSDYDRLADPDGPLPLLNRAIQGEYAPGSTFKLITATAAVKDGYSTDAAYPCPGAFKIGTSRKKNFEGEALGTISLRTAIIKSCDTVFYKFGVEEWQRDLMRIDANQDPLEPMAQMARAFGVGEPTGIDLPGELDGRIPDRAWKRAYWEATKANSCKRKDTGYPEVAATDPARAELLKAYAKENCTDGYYYRGGDAANFSVGQGDVLMTPLQLASAYAAMSNGGTLYQPQLAKAVVAPDGSVVKRFEPQATGQLPVDRATLDYIRSAMMEVTGPSGTARRAYKRFPRGEYPVGGKTGTAEVSGKFDTSWFASFLEKPGAPRYVVVSMVTQAGTGGSISGPATRRVYDAILGVGEDPVAPVAGGRLPDALPRVQPDGSILPPEGTVAAAALAAAGSPTPGLAAPDAGSPAAGSAEQPATLQPGDTVTSPPQALSPFFPPDARPAPGSERSIARRSARRRRRNSPW